MCPDALEDESLEKTMKTYRKLVKDRVQPEDPVPFFSTHEKFRRSSKTLGAVLKGKMVAQKTGAAPMKLSAHDLDPYFTVGNGHLPMRRNQFHLGSVLVGDSDNKSKGFFGGLIFGQAFIWLGLLLKGTLHLKMD